MTRFADFAALGRRLESSPGRLEKRRLVADFLAAIELDEVASAVAFLTGHPFPTADSRVLGVRGFNNGVKHLGALNTMLMLNLIPVIVFAIEAWLGRSYAPLELAGAATVIGALVANNCYLRSQSRALVT